ncbi:MAG: LamG-like jellyroll fold domain-containing protein [Planctomycetota bacterium]
MTWPPQRAGVGLSCVPDLDAETCTMFQTTTAAVAALLLAAPALAQTTWHVDDDACPGPGTGTPSDPFCSIQDAIDAAAAGDTVIVAPGTYPPFEIVEKAIVVRSTEPTDAAVVSSTIISGDWSDPTPNISIEALEGAAPVVSGFSVIGGSQGIAALGMPTITRCVVQGAEWGMILFGGPATVTHCVIRDSSPSHWQEGGGMLVGWGLPVIVNCSFIDNQGTYGGAIRQQSEGDLALTNCLFAGNAAEFGGAISLPSFSPTANVHADNCTFTGNDALLAGDVVHGGDSSPGWVNLTNCIVWANGAVFPTTLDFDGDIGVAAQNSVLSEAPQIDGGGNMIADPNFVAPSSGDYRLLFGSPAIGAGDSTALPADAADVDGDGVVDEPLPLDLAGNPRVAYATLDMGAYEFACPDSPLDCNGNALPDCDDITLGISLDCNHNLVPDECDISDGTSEDCDGNGVPDECDIVNGNDCNGNGTPDACDIAAGTSEDCNGNGVPDECDPDCNGNGIADGCDIASGTSDDTDDDGVPDECETVHNLTSGGTFQFVNDAIDAAVDGDEIVLFPGVYTASIDFNGKAIIVRGSDPSDPQVVAETVLTSDSGRVVRCVSGEGPETVLAGLTIIGPGGGGMIVQGSSPTIEDCVFTDCVVISHPSNPDSRGAGLHLIESQSSITRCVFDGNSTFGSSFNAFGGGMATDWSSPTVTDCVFANNFAHKYGGGLYENSGSSTVIGCSFVQNTANLLGGGIFSSNADVTLSDTIVCGNSPDQVNGPWTDGGGNQISAGCDGDCNLNGVSDELDIANGTSFDCNANGLPDECDLFDGTSADCNGNGVPDSCDLADGSLADCNANGVPDECEEPAPLNGFALDFDQTSDRVTMNGFSGFPGTELTISYWQRTTKAVFNTISYAAGSSDNQLVCYFTNGTLEIWIDQAPLAVQVDLDDGAWHHVAVTWRSDTGATAIYVDGEAVVTTTFQAGSTLQDGGVMMLGDEQDCLGGCIDPAQAFIGTLDEVRLWNVVRTPEAIAADRFTTLAGSESGLVGYWPMDAGAGDVLADLAGANDGVIAGAAWQATSTASTCCPADLDASGVVDVTDLVGVILAWGSTDAAADVNDDGIVDVMDLIEVVVAWGPCS